LSRTKERKPSRPTEMDDARNELFSHIHRCAVLRATEDQQVDWMKDTVEFLGERFPSLGEAELKELYDIGLRFCRPVIVNGVQGEEPVHADEDADGSETDIEGDADMDVHAESLAEEATAA
jgi:hypothetical protein